MTVRIRRPHAGHRFIHPMDPEPRTAVLAPGFQETKMVRVFPRGWNEQAARFSPTSVAGPVEELRRLAISNRLHLEHAVIAFTYEGDAGLSRADRELFWDAFGVPVFEQYFGPHDQLWAVECDAHTGLHVVAGFDVAELERECCPCGNPAPRLARGARIEELAGLLA